VHCNIHEMNGSYFRIYIVKEGRLHYSDGATTPSRAAQQRLRTRPSNLPLSAASAMDGRQHN
jgi:hypothetical protein